MAPPSTRLAAVASTYAAHGYALAGDHTASDRSYDQAQELLDNTDIDPQSSWGAWLDAPYIEVQRARSLVVLGNHATAVEGFEQAIDRLPGGYPQDRGVYLARAAMAHAAGTKSGRITSELQQLDGILGTCDTAEVEEFRDAFRSVCPV